MDVIDFGEPWKLGPVPGNEAYQMPLTRDGAPAITEISRPRMIACVNACKGIRPERLEALAVLDLERMVVELAQGLALAENRREKPDE